MPPGAIYLEEWGQSLQPQLQPTQLPVFFFFFHILLIISATAIRSTPPTAAVDNILAAPNPSFTVISPKRPVYPENSGYTGRFLCYAFFTKFIS